MQKFAIKIRGEIFYAQLIVADTKLLVFAEFFFKSMFARFCVVFVFFAKFIFANFEILRKSLRTANEHFRIFFAGNRTLKEKLMIDYIFLQIRLDTYYNGRKETWGRLR